MSLFGFLKQFIRQHWPRYLAAAAMLACVAVLTVSIPRQVGRIIDGLVAGTLAGSALHWQLAALLGMGLAIYFLRVGWRLQLFAASYRLGVDLRVALYRKLAAQGPGFYQHQRTGDLMARATNDIDAVEMAAGEAMLAGFDGALTLVLVLGMMTLGVDWRLAAVALLPFPLMAFGFWRISRHVHQASTDSLQRFSALNDHVQETLSGVRTLRALGLESRNRRTMAQLAANAADASLAAQRWEAAFEPTVGMTLTAASVLTLSLGGYLVWHGSLSIGQLTSFSMYLGQLIWPMFAAGWVLALLERGKAAWARLDPILSAPLTVDDHGSEAGVPAGTLQLHEVSFSYPQQPQPALAGVSLSLPAGGVLALVGPTGSGKSTLLKLLLRQYSPQLGRILWQGRALDDYTLNALRSAISWVPQEAFLFSASVADNIALVKPDASRADIERVAQLAAVHDDILRLPQGYDTPVGEKGVSLSGGQRQRVAIARALLSDAPLLILDDALSAVDTQTETAILQHLRAARQGRTLLIVSHRLSAVVDADEILVLKQGRVTERGQHSQLLALDGWYASQWRYQQLEASLDEC
ncbi:ABC transporter ATP-binding protein [Vogesella mureinivorans]|uniref:ABC transporter ATP-binding protein n=1 Tax=Vogesella mureinivorans TaxID=657276 RepID=UPI0011CB5302|nr:ABC transporter transmembrane domain-containing protein [Vogesella mureinivorans]